MSVPRGLSPEEQAAWARLASSVTPMPGKASPGLPKSKGLPRAAPVKPPISSPASGLVANPRQGDRPVSSPKPTAGKAPAIKPARPRFNSQLDSHWNRKLKAGQVAPDYRLDLHGHSLDGAHTRVMSGLDQARAMDARVVLVIVGRERPVDPADRSHRRGAIRAQLLDWLAASRHAEAIAAVRRAHIRHGGEGALYLVLRRGG